MRKKEFAVVTLFLFFPPLSAVAGDQQSVLALDEMVVTATRMEERSFDVPTPVEVVSSQELTVSNPASAAQPLESLPGVSVAGSGFWNVMPVIRGMGGNRVLVLIDGDRENNLWAGRSPLVPFIDINNVERIEVVKGPASVLYGTDALGGVVNVISKMPDFAGEDKWVFENSMEGRYSSVDDGRNSRYNLNGGGYGLDFIFALSERDAHSYEDGGGNTVDNSQFKAWNVDFKSRYQLNDDHDISLTFRSNNIDDMGVTKKANAPYSHFTRFDTNTYKLAYHGQNLGMFQDVQFRNWYVEQQRNYEAKIHSSTKPMYTLKENEFDTSALGSSMQICMDINDVHRLVTGFELVHEETDANEWLIVKEEGNDRTARAMTFKSLPNSERDHFGVFAQDEIIIGERWTMLAGLRYDYFIADADDVPFTTDVYGPDGSTVVQSKTTVNHFGRKVDDAVTFNFGLLYVLSEHVHLISNLSSGFRAPDIFERYSTRSSSYMIIGDPDLDPEYSYNIDAGAKVDFSRLRGSFSGFYCRVEDYIDLANTGKLFAGYETREYVNVADAELYGIDGSLEFDLIESLILFGNLAYVEGRERHSHAYLNSIPPLNGLLGMRWQGEVAEGVKYWIEFSGNFYDRQDHTAAGEKATAGYALCNVRSGVTFDYAGFREITLTLNVENLLDKEYRSHLNTEDFYNNPGLNVVAALKFSF